MRSGKIAAILAIGIAVIAGARWPTGALADTAVTPDLDEWPRRIQLPDATVLVYQPQVESWQYNQLTVRMAVAATPTGSKEETFGVIWASALTEVDRTQRLVTLEGLSLMRSNFPTLSDNGAAYFAELSQQLPSGIRTISLDRLQTSLGASGTSRPTPVAVKNDPPQIIVSYAPAILVPIDGPAVLRPVQGTVFDRVVNTHALILHPSQGTTYYLHVYDGWLSADTVDGPWTHATNAPASLDDVARTLGASGQVDLLDGGTATPKPSLAGTVPTIYVAHAPAELVVFKGQPNLQPIGGTTLLWATNTTADVIVDTATTDYYVLLSGRWYRAASLAGPWAFVASSALPPSFAQIPVGSPAGVVLAAVAGTPQAQEAVIENAIPQTATISRAKAPAFTASYDGAPQWSPIDGTPLQYAINSPAPIILVDPQTYYALRAGVWFTASSPDGPWVLASSVPDSIYSIPPSSALHYATYVRIYGSTPEVVYTGYTPGYLGTAVAPDGTVVYGTGYDYPPWIGTTWYARPTTFGIQAEPVYNPSVGMAYGMAVGLTTSAVVDGWNQPVHYDPVYRGYPCCGTTSANVYAQWGSAATSSTVGEAAAGTYRNGVTGTTGQYAASESYNADTGVSQRGYSRTADTATGGTDTVARNERYDAATRTGTYSSTTTATGAGGSQVTHDTAVVANPDGSAVERQTTVDNARTDTTNTYDSARVGNDYYAGANGNVYRDSDDGWQQRTADGWQRSMADASWARQEQQARLQAEYRYRSYQQGWANRFSRGGAVDRSGGRGGRR